ncbi:uncharacterized protein LOC120196569 [Hibiscus syriacus]|uniref:uncharacterized protein LOC120196569 n=1 Tax=Hibiscus syriacus TaxID=106335 RepID=UPI00192142E4|nr:uncharacterized protein LOC120196569 [Hibiscus syriacus]
MIGFSQTESYLSKALKFTRFNFERVDPPVPVLDPLLSWANEAHWSIDDLSFKRLRLLGQIEGNVKRLKAQREKLLNDKDDDPSPHHAPKAVKRRRFFDLNEDGEEEDVDGENYGDEMVVKREAKRVLRKGAVRKLGDDFERMANDKDSGRTSKEEEFQRWYRH